MKIGIFSKIGASGGSEHRCAEMCNGIVRFSDHECMLLCEDKLHPVIEKKLDPKVRVIQHIFKPKECARPDVLYDLDLLLVVNSDSYSFARLEYWEGTLRDKKHNRIKHHKFKIDLERIPKMVFLFNFVVSPAQNLVDIAKKCKDVRIIVANADFYNQIRYKDKFKKIRKKKLPVTMLESPIDPALITDKKTKSTKIDRKSVV